MSEKLIAPVFIREDQRGTFVEIISDRKWEGVNFGKMKAGASIGGKYHKKNEAFFYLLKGRVLVQQTDTVTGKLTETPMDPGYGIHFTPFIVNTVKFTEDSEFILLKSRRYDPADGDSYSYP